MEDPIVIVGYARTPIGAFQGAFATIEAKDLGAAAIKAAIQRAGLLPENIDEVIMGCVLPAGQGQAPARQASLLAGVPNSIGCTTVNKVCGSGMKSVMLAHDLLKANTNKIMLAGGMEHMTKTPYLLDKARSGYRMGHAKLIDHMFLDGLEDAYDKGKAMGYFAELTAEKYQFTRKMQDDFALNSLMRAKKAIENKLFETEITPVIVNTGAKGGAAESTISIDECPGKAKPEKIPELRPAFKENGTVTAANSSSISDGAAALVLMPLSEAQKRNLKPIAKILGHAQHAQDPAWFTTAPVGAIQKLYSKLNLKPEAVGLYEINEAFAVVTLAAMKDLNLPHEKVNVHGGACALGHPIGASGARILCTLLAALEQYNEKIGIASLCIGGGEATAIAVERFS